MPQRVRPRHGRRCTGRRRTSRSPATASAAASAGTAASTASFTNSITAIELVTADGRLRRVDHEHEPELFWALRGGGGNFGVVTALEFRLFPISEVYAGALFFPWERSAEVLQAWLEWTHTVPDEVTSVGRILQFPPIEDVPGHLRGKSFAVIHAYFLGSEADGARVLAPLRALGPAIDTVAMVPPVALSRDAHGPARPAPVPRRAPRARPAPVERDRRVRRCRRARARARPSSRSRSATQAARSVAAAAHHGALDKLPGEYLYFGIGIGVRRCIGEPRRAKTSTASRAPCARTARAAT